MACFPSSDALLGKNLSRVDTVVSQRCIFYVINCLEKAVKRTGHRTPLKLCSKDSHLFSAGYTDADKTPVSKTLTLFTIIYLLHTPALISQTGSQTVRGRVVKRSENVKEQATLFSHASLRSEQVTSSQGVFEMGSRKSKYEVLLLNLKALDLDTKSFNDQNEAVLIMKVIRKLWNLY